MLEGKCRLQREEGGLEEGLAAPHEAQQGLGMLSAGNLWMQR